MSKLYYIPNEPQSRKTRKRVKFNRPTKKYFQESKAFLDCVFSQRWQKTKLLRKTLQDYLWEHPNPTAEELRDAFGTPEELANTIFSRSYTKKLSHKRMWRLCFVLLTFCCIAAIGRCLFLQYQWNNKKNESDYGVAVETYSYDTKRDVERFPQDVQNSIKYDLEYTYTPDDAIRNAYDSDGNQIDVDSSGKPLDPNYPFSEEYRELPDK
ncbi:MAG: DUF6120 family protein [Eubacteriales bacterium]|nr:DUF6120 family protein [Eubacteriales bacterium]